MDRKCGNACERIAKKYDEKVKEYIYIVEEGAIALLSRIQPRNYHFRPNESRGTPLAFSQILVERCDPSLVTNSRSIEEMIQPTRLCSLFPSTLTIV